MTPSLIIKLLALGLSTWLLLGNPSAEGHTVGIVSMLLVFLAVLDAGQAVQNATASNADTGLFLRRLCGFSVGPLYMGLLLMT